MLNNIRTSLSLALLSSFLIGGGFSVSAQESGKVCWYNAGTPCLHAACQGASHNVCNTNEDCSSMPDGVCCGPEGNCDMKHKKCDSPQCGDLTKACLGSKACQGLYIEGLADPSYLVTACYQALDEIFEKNPKTPMNEALSQVCTVGVDKAKTDCVCYR